MKNSIFVISLFLLFFFLFGCNQVGDKADKAIQENNPALCKELEDEDDVKKCFAKVAGGMNDPNVCFQSPDAPDCIGNYAVEKQSTKYCDLLNDTAAKYGCVVRVTGDQTGRAIDKILQDWRGNGTIKNCKEGCEATKSACTEAGFQTWTKAKEECFKNNPVDSDDRIWCDASVKETFENHKLGCWDKQDECNKGCEQ